MSERERERGEGFLRNEWDILIKGELRQTQKLSGFVNAFHPAAPGSNPEHTIYAFHDQIDLLNSSYYVCRFLKFSLKMNQNLKCNKI